MNELVETSHGEMTQAEIAEAFRAIGLALHATHNTVATDDVTAVPSETAWRVDHSQEVALLDRMQRHFSALVPTSDVPVVERTL